MKMRIRISGFEDVDYTGDTLPRDILQWELADHKRSISDFSNNQKYADVYEIAWHCARRVGVITREVPLADFMVAFDVEILKAVDEDDEDPKAGNPEPSTTPSSS